MAMWNRETRGRDLGDRARDLADRAESGIRRGMERMRGGEAGEYRGSERGDWSRGDWNRTGEYGRWGGRRFEAAHERSDLGDQHRAAPVRNREERDVTYRGVPGSSVYGGVSGGERGRRYEAGGRDESGYGSVHYDRDFGYGAFGAVRDRGFEDRPYDAAGIHRSRDDQHAGRYGAEYEGSGRYDREMRGAWHDTDRGDPFGDRARHTPFRMMRGRYRGESEWGAESADRDANRGEFGERGWMGRDRGSYDRGWGAPRGMERTDLNRGDRFNRMDSDRMDRMERERGMTAGWRGEADRAFDEYGGYSHGLGDEPYFNRDDFRGREAMDRGYDREFDRDWF